MKKRLIAVLTIAMMLLSMGIMQAFAADEDGSDVTYRLTIYSGNQGSINGGKVWTQEYKPGDFAEINLDSIGFKLDNDKYYPRGLRLTGHDNNEAATGDSTGAQNLNIRIYQDLDYEVAYGIKGNMVEYTVRYEDDAGNELLPADTFYGAIGDKPMVAFRYVDGYLPQAYNITGTLKEGENEFVFVYTAVQGNQNVQTIINPVAVGGVNAGVAGAGAAGAGAAGAGAAGAGAAGAGAAGAGAAGAGATIGDGATPTTAPQNVVDIDNSGTPTTDNPDGTSAIDDNKTPKTNWAAIGGGAAVVVAIAALLAIFLKRRRDLEELEDEE